MSAKKIFLVLSLFVLLFSCTSKNEIIGSWKLEKVNIEKAISIFKDDQKDFARMMMTQAFENVKGKMKMTFIDGGKYEITTPLIDGSIKTEKGSWSMSKDKKKLFLITADSGKEMHRILKFTSTKLVLEMSQSGFGDMEMSFVKE